MRRPRRARPGDGTAWLVVDRLHGDYLCDWYASTNDGHLVEHARVASASDAVAWGRLRTTRVRIRTADGCTSWAGTAPRPEGFTHTWTDSTVASVAPRASDTGRPVPEQAGEPGHANPPRAGDHTIPSPRGREMAGGGPRGASCPNVRVSAQ
jgi:hypothetical protein